MPMVEPTTGAVLQPMLPSLAPILFALSLLSTGKGYTEAKLFIFAFVKDVIFI
jgi:hypothetical protein